MADTTAPTITANPLGSTYGYSIIVSLISDESATTIYYTTNGTTPTTSSSIYSSPLTINSTTTLKYFGKDSSGNNSAVQTQVYTIDTVTPTVTASPSGGTYSTAKTVTLSSNKTNKTIYYTLDGTIPTTDSTQYTTPISISSSTTLKFFVKDNVGNNSTIQTEIYTIDNVAPVITPNIPTGTYSTPISVMLASNEVATIFYTLDGTTPTTASAVYSTAIPISTTKTLKVIGKDSLGNISGVQTFTYAITTQAGTLGAIDKTRKPDKVRLFLCRPNRSIVAEISEAYNKELKTSYNGIHEYNFTIPYKVIRKNRITVNPNFSLVKGDYLIKYVKGDVESWFVIAKVSNTGADRDEKSVQCFLLPYQLRKKLLRDYKGTKKLYDFIGTDGFLNDTLIKKTNWSVGYVDSDIATKVRTMDVSEQSLIEFVDALTEAFGCVVVWDSKNKKVHFYKESNYGVDRGLVITEGKYLKSITEEPDFESVATRVYVYGKDNISFNAYNPSGTDYLESLDYYMYPFQRDANKVVQQSSLYMSDSLCNGWLDYQAVLTANAGNFSSLITQLSNLQSQKATKDGEMEQLNTDMKTIEDALAVQKATGNTANIATLEAQKSAKQTQINNKQAEIDSLVSQINTVNSQIASAKSTVNIANNLSPAQLVELNDFIQEKIITNQYITSEQELYNFAKEQIVKFCQPLIHYTIDVVDFTKALQGQRDWGKLNYGDIITVKYPKFGTEIKARIVSITHNEDSNSISLEIANSNDINSGFLSLKDLYQKTNQSSTTLDMSKYKWDMSEQNNDSINALINAEFDATKRRIIAGVDESIEISRKGIVITNPNFPNEMLIAQSGVLALSMDGGNTWKTAIKPDRIVADLVMGKLITGVNLIIENESGKYRFDKDGFTIEGGSLTITNGLPENQMNPDSVNRWNTAKDNIDNFLSDNTITPYEKTKMQEEWNNIVLQHNTNSQTIDVYFVNNSTIDFVKNYNDSFNALYNCLFVDIQGTDTVPLLDSRNMSLTSHVTGTVISNKFSDFYTAQEEVKRQIAIKAKDFADQVQSNLNEVKDDIVYKTELHSTAGNQFLNGSISTTVYVVVYKGKDNVTSTLPNSAFKWKKTDKDGNADTAWNTAHAGVGSSIQVSHNDVWRKATFWCDIDIT